MAQKQFYSIKYPFMNECVENYLVDLNTDRKEKVRSLLMHVIFTPKGQKLRDPEFGTNLVKYIFDPNDGISWDGVKNEVSEAVNKYVKGVTINNVSILEHDDDRHQIYVRLDYSVVNGFKVENDSLVTKL